MFHMLRRQMRQAFRKPLIVMSPKSLLRDALSVSPLEDLTRGSFARVIGEIEELGAADVRRVVFCSGKVYFDLLKARRKESLRDVALVRIEQLYPFPSEEYDAVLNRFPNAREVVWCQEEPQNQGAWYQIRHRLQEAAGRRTLLYAGRAPAAAPATGIAKIHELEQQALVAAALHSTTTEESARETTRLTAVVPGAGAAAPAGAAEPAAGAGQSAPPPPLTPIRKRS
jgi:2-oxoglutarate dehydrogenase E1 component